MLWHWIAALIVLVVVGVFGWLKHKAIGAVTGAAWSGANKWFGGYVQRQLQTVEKPTTPQAAPAPTNQRTYRGRFGGYFQYENHPCDWFFEIEKQWSAHESASS